MIGKKLFFFGVLFLTCLIQANANTLPTEFSYSKNNLSRMYSSYAMSGKSMDRWEQPLQNYFESNQVPYLTQVRFYTYLYLAQKDAAFLSYSINQRYTGSLDPLTKRVVQAFFPDFVAFPSTDSDKYSNELAKIVWDPYQQRLEQEQANTHTFTPCNSKPIPSAIQNVAKWIPWSSTLPQSTPPSTNLNAQIDNMKTTYSQQDNQQSPPDSALEDKTGMKHHWRMIANQYMQKKGTDLGKLLYVRSALMRGIYDTLISVYDAKYTYCVPRSWEIDETHQPNTQRAQSPSYPSAYAGVAGVSEVILTCFLPENRIDWENMAEDDGQSRIQAGVHTSQDISEGRKLGMIVGDTLCRQMENMDLPSNGMNSMGKGTNRGTNSRMK